jgi:hypothetical protein
VSLPFPLFIWLFIGPKTIQFSVLANGVDRVLGESGENLVIIAKNIDSPLLRPLALQEALAELAKATRIRLIVSKLPVG